MANKLYHLIRFLSLTDAYDYVISMGIKHLFKHLVLIILVTINLSNNYATAQPTPKSSLTQKSTQKSVTTPEEQQIQELERLQRSQEIEEQVEEEVDRTVNTVFETTINLINWNIGIINLLFIIIPIGGALAFWFFRIIIIRKLESDIKNKLEKEIEATQEKVIKSLQERIDTNQVEIDKLIRENTSKISEAEEMMSDIQNKINQLKSDLTESLEKQKEFVNSFMDELNLLFTDAQREKDTIVQKLSKLAPPLSSLPDTHQPDIQKQIQELTAELEDLKLGNPQLFFTTDDYLKQGDALFFEGSYKDAIKSYDEVIERQPDSYSAWVSRGWALRRINKFKEALKAYDKAIEINPDHHIGQQFSF
ncbi:tetratricopeptide repeat protein [Mastigocoleus sp. MO_188.B34]|uniref:tetratricopeptide repeat protein n=1 Tax=Mastigocoleus sp. MO_188.B34 TaxID=3036635 RepID=UPI00262854D8|nr:tetratricopeptide repeat protein [Mastigocoleus sp. MO_188.B34]